MKFKRLCSGVLVAGLLLTNTAGFASQEATVTESLPMEKMQSLESKHTQAEAERIMKQYVKSFFNFDLDQSSENMNTFIEFRDDWYSKKGIWQLNYNQHNNEKYVYVNVTIDDKTGNLLSIRKHEGNTKENTNISQYTFAEAKKVASNFINNRLNPQLIKQLSSEPKQQSNYYHPYEYNRGMGLHAREYFVFFEREHDGIPFMNDGVHIGVNSATGEVVSYEYRWTEEELPKRNGVVGEEKARDVFKESVELELGYIPVTDFGYYGSPIKDVKLVYYPSYTSGHLVDANTGELINQHSTNRDSTKKIDVSPQEKKQFSSLEKVKVVRKNEMSKEEALKMATSILKSLYGEVKIESSSYYSNKGMNNEKNWNIQFNIGNDRHAYGSININAMTEEVVNLYYHNWYKKEMAMAEGDFTPVLEWEEAYKKSIEIIKELYPDKLKDVRTEQTYYNNFYEINGEKYNNPEYHFNFSREAHGIIFNHNNISVAFDNTTGLLQSLYYRWDDITLPKPEGTIAKEKALDIYVEQTKTELAYGSIQPKEEKATPELKLVYRNLPKGEFLFHTIDAKTGKFLDYRGMEVKEEKQKADSTAKLLEGHWAERELTIMYDNGVVDLQNFNLAEEVPKKEIIRMMVRAMGSGYYHMSGETKLMFTDINEDNPYYEDIKTAVRMGIIKNEAVAFDGDSHISREEMAVMLVKLAGLEKLANIKGIHTLPVADIDEINPEYLGHTALAYGLDVIKGDGENYKPKERVTFVQAAVSIYRGFKNMFNIFR